MIKFRCREKRPKKKKKNKKDSNSRETRDADEGRHGGTNTATYIHSDGKSDSDKISGRTGVIASDTSTSENNYLVTKATEVTLSANNVTRSPRDKISQLEHTGGFSPSAQTDGWLNLTTGTNSPSSCLKGRNSSIFYISRSQGADPPPLISRRGVHAKNTRTLH